MTGAAMVHVPYKGSGPANAALLAGEISVIFEGLGSSACRVRAEDEKWGKVVRANNIVLE